MDLRFTIEPDKHTHTQKKSLEYCRNGRIKSQNRFYSMRRMYTYMRHYPFQYLRKCVKPFWLKAKVLWFFLFFWFRFWLGFWIGFLMKLNYVILNKKPSYILNLIMPMYDYPHAKANHPTKIVPILNREEALYMCVWSMQKTKIWTKNENL